MQPVKGVHVLLNALALLKPGTFEAELYGDIEAKPEYVKELGDSFGKSVRLRGNAPPQDIPRVLSSFDVLVCPSIWWENSPLVIHEAFAAGIPVRKISRNKLLVQDFDPAESRHQWWTVGDGPPDGVASPLPVRRVCSKASIVNMP